MKKLIMTVLVAALAAGMAATAFAQTPPQQGPGGGWGRGGGGSGFGGLMWRLMLDENGALLDREVFEQRLNQALASGIINAWERERMQAIYEWRQQFDPETVPGGRFGRGGFGPGSGGGWGRGGGGWGRGGGACCW